MIGIVEGWSGGGCCTHMEREGWITKVCKIWDKCRLGDQHGAHLNICCVF